MALGPCRECGRRVSTEATTCPHCGVIGPVATSGVAGTPRDLVSSPSPFRRPVAVPQELSRPSVEGAEFASCAAGQRIEDVAGRRVHPDWSGCARARRRLLVWAVEADRQIKSVHPDERGGTTGGAGCFTGTQGAPIRDERRRD